MSDYYLALVDPTANRSNTKQRSATLRDALVSERIILPEMSEDCVYGGVGHLPGPRLNESYVFDAMGSDTTEIRYWDEQGICGVEIHADKWVNDFGIIVFEWAKCPGCNHTFENGSEIMQPLVDAMGEFLEHGQPAVLECPECAEEENVQQWITEPHLGFCHLAIQFWNWPDFDAKGWKISIPQIASRAIGHPLIPTYGRM